jgi:hypothetical protein
MAGLKEARIDERISALWAREVSRSLDTRLEWIPRQSGCGHRSRWVSVSSVQPHSEGQLAEGDAVVEKASGK